MRQEKTKYINMSCPIEICEYFEKQAADELDEDGEVVNQISLGRKRNEMIISALYAAIKIYEEM
jgi:hypothetical protein